MLHNHFSLLKDAYSTSRWNTAKSCPHLKCLILFYHLSLKLYATFLPVNYFFNYIFRKLFFTILATLTYRVTRAILDNFPVTTVILVWPRHNSSHTLYFNDYNYLVYFCKMNTYFSFKFVNNYIFLRTHYNNWCGI